MNDTASSSSTPLHGFRGDLAEPMPNRCGWVVGLNRQAGAQGTTIARLVAERLGWSLYTPEMIDFLARDEQARQELLGGVSSTNQVWADYQIQNLMQERRLAETNDSTAIARLVYLLGLRGDAVIVGRAAGFLLPIETTLHVRIVAPWAERIAYIAQWMRLSETEAAEEAKNQDARRATFLKPFTDTALDEPTAYDLILNAGRMSVANIAELIVQALRLKQDLARLDHDQPDTEAA